jgi:Arf-GAP with SH3 domain, ANK repeat and PH domain-containing protein
MRSVTLDTTSFNSNLVNLLRLLPNSVSNSVWERVPNQSFPKPTAQSSYEARHAYITAKYVNKAFVEPLPSSTTANELLIRSITHGDLKGVLWAIASKADPNTRAPILPALIVALLQDDKMAYVLSKTDSSSSSGSVQQVSKFPFAELLLLNGAMPVDPKTLPVEANALSDGARRYLQDKLDRILQNSQSPPAQYSLPSRSSSGVGMSTGSTSSQSGGNTIGGDLNRTVSKLQKRLSQSGKTFRREVSPPLDKE